ncbi:outer membrane beta-barrel protein [Pontiellaceae bacterium B12219]|nr:outer membrane beta-barrel protein [Pontiellaceae bacterium B12219]
MNCVRGMLVVAMMGVISTGWAEDAAPGKPKDKKQYISIGLGGASQSAASYKESGLFLNADAEADFGGGGAFNICYGSKLKNTPMRLEVELLFTGVDIDSFEDKTFGTLPVGEEAGSFLFAGLFNAYLDWNNSSPVTPYIMGGIGGGAYSLDFDNGMGEGSAGSFLGQFGLGASVALNETIAFDFKYKNIIGTDPEFDIEGGGTATTELNMQQYMVSIMIYF